MAHLHRIIAISSKPGDNLVSLFVETLLRVAHFKCPEVYSIPRDGDQIISDVKKKNE